MEAIVAPVEVSAIICVELNKCISLLTYQKLKEGGVNI
jgi:hypothetical protein